MTDIPTDVKYSFVDVTRSISINENVLVDSNKNLYCNEIRCGKLYTDELHTSTDDGATTRSFDPTPEAKGSSVREVETNAYVMGVSNHCTGYGSSILGGEHNEIQGKYSSILGGRENEVDGHYSTVVGGKGHQCLGNHSACFGVNSVVQHDFSIVLNTDNDKQAFTTDHRQCVLSASNGTYIRLPSSNAIRTDHVAEGMACFVWDDSTKSVCMKTKQNDILYKTSLLTSKHEIEVGLSTDNDSVKVAIKNPDQS